MPPASNGGIVRINHDQGRWFRLSRALAQDETISFALRGLLAYLLSKPDGWEVNTKNLIRSSPGGRDFVYRLLKEGIKAGYMHRHRKHNPETGHFDWVTDAYESPTLNPFHGTDTTSGKPVDGEPVDGEPVDGKTVDGKTRHGKPAHLEETELSEETELQKETEETEETEGEETEGRNDDDGTLLTHWFRKWGGGAGGGVGLGLAMRKFAADTMAALPDWDDGLDFVADLDAEGLICLVEWDAHLTGDAWARLDNPIGFLRTKVTERKRPGLTTHQGKALIQKFKTHYITQEIPY